MVSVGISSSVPMSKVVRVVDHVSSVSLLAAICENDPAGVWGRV